jgi:energy-converting hydrogenase Eha subunit A
MACSRGWWKDFSFGFLVRLLTCLERRPLSRRLWMLSAIAATEVISLGLYTLRHGVIGVRKLWM